MQMFLLIITFFLMLNSCSDNKHEDTPKAEFGQQKTDTETNTLANDKQNIRSNSTLPTQKLKAVVVNKWYHDSEAYTQGLVYHNGFLYESTGNYGASSLRKVELETGKVIKIHRLPGFHFGEGLTVYDGKIYQITWRSRTCFVYELETFSLINTFTFDGEGWGLTNNENQLIMSDGTNQIKFIDPESFKIIRKISVRDDNQYINEINELEYINGEIFANIYMKPEIVRINPESGVVIGRIDLSALYQYLPANSKAEVLNGIAYDPTLDRYFLTGKYWEYIFEVKFEPL